MEQEALAPATDPAEGQQPAETITDSPASEQVAEQTEEQRQEEVAKAASTLNEEKQRKREAFERRQQEKVQAQAWQQIATELARTLAQGKQQPTAGQVPAAEDDPKPSRDDPRWAGKDWDDYQAEVARWNARQEFRRLVGEHQQQTQAQQEQMERMRVESEHRNRNREFAKAMPDFADVTDRDDIVIPGPAVEAIQLTPNGPAIQYAIGKNPEIAAHLSRLNPTGQQILIGQLSAYLASQSPRISNAAPAGRTVGAKPSPSGELPEDTDSYMNAANKKFGRR